MNATCYSVTLDKTNMHHPMTLATSMPLQLQALVEHFDVECKAIDRMGMIVADWSAHHQDQHASRCVASFASSRNLQVHPSVYYASSHGSEGIQVCDLLTGVRRRAAEGDNNLLKLDGNSRAFARQASLAQRPRAARSPIASISSEVLDCDTRGFG